MKNLRIPDVNHTGHIDLSSELTSLDGIKVLSWWTTKWPRTLHAFLTVGLPIENHFRPPACRFKDSVSYLDRQAIASGKLVPLDVFAASWKELCCAHFAGVYLGSIPDKLVDQLAFNASLEEIFKKAYPQLFEDVEVLLWDLWEQEPYCPKKDCGPDEDDIRPIQSAHHLIPSASGMTLAAKSRILTFS
ncbi:hypothetical protein [Limnohabitans sp. T6-5]|uniref:hypothetical protein n=1 Tax=Limnohabitans sp. T6-5 TaxID=1100724 RepID=UPI0011B2363B|nr:hypothetical protein [Limnohabitans sp. T6-5]